MNSIESLRKDADQRQLVFRDQLSRVIEQVQPHRLADDAVAAFGSNVDMMQRVMRRIEMNPIALLAAVTGLFLLVRQLSSNSTAPKPKMRLRRPSTRRSTKKGVTHG